MGEITANGLTYDLADKYGEGYTVDAAEAAALNQLRARKVSAAWSQLGRNTVKRGAEFDNSQDAFNQYAQNYTFGQRSGGGGAPRTKDPVIVEARKIVREAMIAQLKATGGNIKSLPKEQVSAYIEEQIKREDVLGLARERVQGKKTIELGTLPGASTPTTAPTPTEPEVLEGEVVSPPSEGRQRRRDR